VEVEKENPLSKKKGAGGKLFKERSALWLLFRLCQGPAPYQTGRSMSIKEEGLRGKTKQKKERRIQSQHPFQVKGRINRKRREAKNWPFNLEKKENQARRPWGTFSSTSICLTVGKRKQISTNRKSLRHQPQPKEGRKVSVRNWGGANFTESWRKEEQVRMGADEKGS